MRLRLSQSGRHGDVEWIWWTMGVLVFLILVVLPILAVAWAVFD